MSWQIQNVKADSTELETLLADGWEPFAVTQDRMIWRVWLRKES